MPSKTTKAKIYAPYTALINVPSGRLVFGNDFRPLVNIQDDYDIMTLEGLEQATKAYAEAGVIHAFVGNTAPDIYQTESVLNIVCPAQHVSSSDVEWVSYPTDLPDGVRRGEIVTDLWWYSAMDYEHYKARLIGLDHKVAELVSSATHTVGVEPGMYRVTVQGHLLPEDWVRQSDNTEYCLERILSFIERIGDVGPIPQQSEHFTALKRLEDFETFIRVMRLVWGDIFPSRNSVLGHMFLTVGNGHHWVNGTLASVSTAYINALRMLDTADTPIVEPKDNCHTFYPISRDHSGIFNIPVDIKPDWLVGAREIINAVIAAGPLPTEKDFYGDLDPMHNVKMAIEANRVLDLRFGSRGIRK